MNRSEFEDLRNIPGKIVTDDIVFARKNATTFSFQGVRILNELGWNVVLNGTYKPSIPAVKYNFVLQGTGPICRVEVNGAMHCNPFENGQRGENVGRTHKHDLKYESCPRKNLPHAIARPDIEHFTPRELWELLCTQAKINHSGKFVDP